MENKTNRIIKMMSHRDKLFLKWNKTRGDVKIPNAYKKFRNRTRQEIRKKENIIRIILKRTKTI